MRGKKHTIYSLKIIAFQKANVKLKTDFYPSKQDLFVEP